MRVLVTGGAGYIGRQTAKALAKAGIDPFFRLITIVRDSPESCSCYWASSFILMAVPFSVATRAERYQILRHIPTKLAPALYVVNLQVCHSAAILAAPTISL
jgi:nucleoside-diphosphate-sugar epimerase